MENGFLVSGFARDGNVLCSGSVGYVGRNPPLSHWCCL